MIPVSLEGEAILQVYLASALQLCQGIFVQHFILVMIRLNVLCCFSIAAPHLRDLMAHYHHVTGSGLDSASMTLDCLL